MPSQAAHVWAGGTCMPLVTFVKHRKGSDTLLQAATSRQRAMIEWLTGKLVMLGCAGISLSQDGLQWTMVGVLSSSVI